MHFQEAFFEETFVVLCDVDGAGLALAAVVAGHLSFEVDHLVQKVVVRVLRGLGVDLHTTNYNTTHHLHRHTQPSQNVTVANIANSSLPKSIFPIID